MSPARPCTLRALAMFAALLLCSLLSPSVSLAGDVSAPAHDAAALSAHRAWWHAYTTGDAGALAIHTADDAAVTFSGGTTLSRAELLDQASKHSRAAGFSMAWSDEAVRASRDGMAVVTATTTERAGNSEQAFRIVTVLDRATGKDWKVVFAQSTRVSRFAPRVPPDLSGSLGDYAGDYRTPKGKLLRIELRGAALWMVEPEGKAIEFTPIGPGLFEPTGRSPLNGILRFVFARDASGAVISLSRLSEGRVDAFPRAS